MLIKSLSSYYSLIPFFALVSVLLALSHPTRALTRSNNVDSTDSPARLLFYDDFLGTNLSSVWSTTGHGWRTLPNNHEEEYYVDSTIKCTDPVHGNSSIMYNPFSFSNDAQGILTISARPVTPYEAENCTKIIGDLEYLSGIISTDSTFYHLTGYWEIRVKFPIGKGLWPAYWLVSQKYRWPPEIDIFEVFGGKNEHGEGANNTVHVDIHPEANGTNTLVGWHTVPFDITADYHIYGLEWTNSSFSSYIDNKYYGNSTIPSIFTDEMYILINLAVGGNGSWPGPTSKNNTWPAEFKIDWVRVWDKKPTEEQSPVGKLNEKEIQNLLHF